MKSKVEETAWEGAKEWDDENGCHFLCCSLIASNDKTRIRVLVHTGPDLLEAGVDPTLIKCAPEEPVVLEFGGGNLKKLINFFKGIQITSDKETVA